MRSFGIVDHKVAEADFFCSRVDNARFSEVSYFFSAFIAALRSITFAVQASLNGATGFEQWYGDWQVRLKEDPLSRFFHLCRTDSQHLGFCPIKSGVGRDGKIVHFFGQPEQNRYPYLPDEDVYSACFKQMRTICSLVDDCYKTFGILIDPDQAYSFEGLRSRGQTLEDLEEETGFPRGWTDIPSFGDGKAEMRLKVLRHNLPMSTCKKLLAKYLVEI